MSIEWIQTDRGIEVAGQLDRVSWQTFLGRVISTVMALGIAYGGLFSGFVVPFFYVGGINWVTMPLTTDWRIALIGVGGLLSLPIFMYMGVVNVLRVVQQWVWYLFGREVIKIGAEGLQIARFIGRFPTQAYRYTWREIYTVDVVPRSADWINERKGLVMFRPIHYGDLQLHARGGGVRFGCTNDETELLKITEAIKERVRRDDRQVEEDIQQYSRIRLSA